MQEGKEGAQVQSVQIYEEEIILTNLIIFYNETSSSADKEVDVINLDFNKAFDIVFHNILKDKLRKYVANIVQRIFCLC